MPPPRHTRRVATSLSLHSRATPCPAIAPPCPATASRSQEASIKTNARGRRVHVFDLGFEVVWQAAIDGKHFDGRLLFSDVSSGSDPEDYEVSIVYDAYRGRPAPESGSARELALVGLIGPLRPQAALAADGVLTNHIWQQLLIFKEEFDAL